jgi:hypothetical protein
MKRLIISVLLCLGAVSAVQGFDHSHAVLDELLGQAVNASGVNYAKLKNDRAPLNSYLDSLAAVSEVEFKGFTKNQQMALLINLYNAATLKLVVAHDPVKSIKEISAASGGPWKQPVIKWLGKSITLDALENEILRPTFQDPRVHFAINCASLGCPALRNQAFQADKLQSQLDEQTRAFLRDHSKNRLDAKTKTLYLSSIFDWFKADFVNKSGSVEKFIAPFVEANDRAVIERGGLTLKSTDYSWSLNQQ